MLLLKVRQKPPLKERLREKLMHLQRVLLPLLKKMVLLKQKLMRKQMYLLTQKLKPRLNLRQMQSPKLPLRPMPQLKVKLRRNLKQMRSQRRLQRLTLLPREKQRKSPLLKRIP